MTTQKLNLWNKGIDWHIQKEQGKCLLGKNQSFSDSIQILVKQLVLDCISFDPSLLKFRMELSEQKAAYISPLISTKSLIFGMDFF